MAEDPLILTLGVPPEGLTVSVALVLVEAVVALKQVPLTPTVRLTTSPEASWSVVKLAVVARVELPLMRQL